MDNAEWFDYYDEQKLSFKWFILRYFVTDIWLDLEKAREQNNRGEMTNIMNNIWINLPDHKFNIIRNPLGWEEFLHLIED